MHLVISNQGNLGRALAAECGTKTSFSWFSDAREDSKKSYGVGVYVGRSEQGFKEFLSYCASYRMPVLQCSSEIDLSAWPSLWCPVIDVPNAAAAARLFLDQVEHLAARIKRHRLSVEWMLTESHQAPKISPPRTALRVAELLGIPKEKIQSLRRRHEFHAYHGLQGYLKDSSEVIELHCRIEGLEPYAKGIIDIAHNVEYEQRETGGRGGGLCEVSDIRVRP